MSISYLHCKILIRTSMLLSVYFFSVEYIFTLSITNSVLDCGDGNKCFKICNTYILKLFFDDRVVLLLKTCNAQFCLSHKRKSWSSVYEDGHPYTSILRSTHVGQSRGYSRRQRAATGVGSWFSTTVNWSVLPGNVYK